MGNAQHRILGHAQTRDANGDILYDIYYIGHDCPHCSLSLGVTERDAEVYYQCSICGYARPAEPADLLTEEQFTTRRRPAM